MEESNMKRKGDENEPTEESPAKKVTDPVQAQHMEDELQELQRKSKQLRDEIEVIVTEGPGNWYMDSVIEQIHQYNQIKDMAQSVIGVISNLDNMSLLDVYDSLGFNYEDEENM